MTVSRFIDRALLVGIVVMLTMLILAVLGQFTVEQAKNTFIALSGVNLILVGLSLWKGPE